MANDIVKLDWNTADKLIPVCREFMQKHANNESIDPHDAANKIGQALGIENVDKEALKQFKGLMTDGLGQVFEAKDSKAIADVFAKNCKPVMELLYKCSQGKMNASQLFDGLDAICKDSADALEELLQHSLGVPDETAKLISEKLGKYTVSIYAFAAAYRIYQSAAKDAALAKERRIEIERLAAEAITELKSQRAEMELLVSNYMLDRLLPFNESVAAMDQAIIDEDDEGFIKANAELWKLFGHEAQYKTAAEFDDLMFSDEAFKL